jgi:hypothetical protein
MAKQRGGRDAHQDHQDGLNSEARDLAEGDAQAEQADADAQDGARAELDAGDAAPLLMQEVEGQAEQQREQHDRRAVMLRQEGGGEPDRHGDDHPGICGMQQLAEGQPLEQVRWRPMLDVGDAFHAVERRVIGGAGDVPLAIGQAHRVKNSFRSAPGSGLA